MTTEMETLVAQVKDGSLSPEKAGAQVAQLIKGSAPAPQPGSEEYKDRAFSRMADKDDDGYENSFNVIVAAWVAGDLSDGQYHTIRDIVTQGTSGNEQEEADEDDDNDED